jgi:hypothetical protein
MNYDELHEDIRILMEDANKCTVTNDQEAETTSNAIVVCNTMRNELESVCASLSRAAKLYKEKLDAYAQKKLSAKDEPKPAPALSLDLDDFDEGPVDEIDELAAEITKSQKGLF